MRFIRFLILLFLSAAWPSASAQANPNTLPTWKLPVEIASGHGIKGPWHQNDSRYDYVDDPAAVYSHDGQLVLAWVDQARKDIYVQRFTANGDALATPINVSRNASTFSWLPRLIVAPDTPGRVYVLWQEIIFSGASHGGEILIARSDDGGASFSSPQNLSHDAHGYGKGRINKDIWHNGSYDLAAAPGGLLYVVWTQYDGGLWFSRSTDAGVIFSQPRRLSGTFSKPARAPTMTAVPNGMLLIAWTLGEDASADIQLATSRDGGLHFDPTRTIAASAGYSDAPRIASDNKGVIHLTYAESRGGPFDVYSVLYTRSTDGGTQFEAPRRILPGLKGGSSAGFPHLAISGDGAVFIVWEHYPSARSRAAGLGFSHSDDGGEHFSAPILIPQSADASGGINGSQQGMSNKVTAGPGGKFAVVNSSLRIPNASRIWLIRGELVRRSSP